MLKIIKAEKRHFQDHGWLKTYWLFSFDSYFDPDNVQFGILRVFNDDKVAPGQGFDMHRHREMEIVSIILNGAITHQDSLGNQERVAAGEVQVMTAGKGIMHSEYNLEQKELHLYQVWFLPNKEGLTPSYDQKDFSKIDRNNKILTVVSGKASENGALFINSDAQLSLGKLEEGRSIQHAVDTSQKSFIYLTSGKLSVNDIDLHPGDQVRMENEPDLEIKSAENSDFILIELF